MTLSKGIPQARIGHEVPSVVAIDNSLIVTAELALRYWPDPHQEDRPRPQRLRLFGSVCVNCAPISSGVTITSEINRGSSCAKSR